MPVEIFGIEQFKQALPENSSIPFMRDGEYCFNIPVTEYGVIQVRSSIGIDGKSADCGENSIRVYILDTNGNPLGGKLVRWTTRQPGWQERLGALLDRLIPYCEQVGPCPVCSRIMRINVTKAGSNKGRPFLSCSAKSDNGSFANHHFQWLDEEEEKRTCPDCNEPLRIVKIKKGSNAGKEALCCSAKDEDGNYLNHYFKVID